VEASQRRGLGLVFGPSSMWGNGQARRVELSDFSVRARPDYVPVPNVPAKSKEQVLTVPRFRKEQPPMQAILAPNGDVLRGRIEAVTASGVRFSSGLETVDMPLSRLAAAVWLRKATPKPAPGPTGVPAPQPFVATHWVVLQDGARLALAVDAVTPSEIKGWCPSLGDCKISLERIAQLGTDELPPTAAMRSYQDWQLVFAEEPVVPETGGQSSPLLGKQAPPFALRMLEGGTITADTERGTVLVLDFWATWCGPCVQSLPATLQVMKQFDPAQVRFVAVNQGEADDQVRRFLVARGLEMSVGMDVNQAMAKTFGVDSIPHTVVVDKTGKVVWVNTGAGGEAKLATAIQDALKLN
jgi:thiol-disulfide isomerase/thioredoxin